MKLANHEIQTVYLVFDNENVEAYQFNTKEAALRWKQELIEEFDIAEEKIKVLERKFDEYGNWAAQNYI